MEQPGRLFLAVAAFAGLLLGAGGCQVERINLDTMDPIGFALFQILNPCRVYSAKTRLEETGQITSCHYDFLNNVMRCSRTQNGTSVTIEYQTRYPSILDALADRRSYFEERYSTGQLISNSNTTYDTQGRIQQDVIFQNIGLGQTIVLNVSAWDAFGRPLTITQDFTITGTGSCTSIPVTTVYNDAAGYRELTLQPGSGIGALCAGLQPIRFRTYFTPQFLLIKSETDVSNDGSLDTVETFSILSLGQVCS